MKSASGTPLWLGLVTFLLALSTGAAAQTYSKTEAIEYSDDLSMWVIGQEKKLTVNGVVVAEATFNANAQVETVKRFGKLEQTLSYNVNGALATVRDGNNNTTTYSSWKRGVPQNIKYADNFTESAVVNDNGWIASAIDENGYQTGYTYDAMGRLASITHPADDSVPWAGTAIVFELVNVAEYGIPAGHWRQAISTGNARKFTYFDARLKVLLTREYDTANQAGTERFQRFAYDEVGRLTFASYFSATDAVTAGVWTQYDPLGRVTSVSQDSELGLLTTLTEYQAGFKTRVTNPRGKQTTISYQVFDQPSMDAPVSISHPEGAFIDIARDVFVKPLAIIRRNADSSQRVERRFVYDSYHQLCKSIEPEVGSTVMDYDAANNLAWSAAGHVLSDSTNCNRDVALIGGRKVERTYDVRNRLKTLGFPDGKGNQIWSYTADGLPSQITTYNDANNGAPVVNTYIYNKLRLLTAESSSQPGSYAWNLGYGYSSNGHLASQTYPNGLAVTYNPNALGQPTLAGAYATGVTYYPNGGMKQFTYGNGIIHTMTQNARRLPARSTDAGVIDYETSFDENANSTAILDRMRGDQFSRWLTYDGLDRLTDAGSCSFGGDCWHRFTYDALDNLKSWKLPGVKDYADYVYDARNRLANIKNSSGATVVGLAYDPQGNLENKNGVAYTFDYGNRLRDVPSKESYRYDSYGRRVQAWTPTSGNIFSQYGQAGQLLYQANERQAKNTAYVYLNGSLVARVTNSTAPATPVLTVPSYNITGSYTVNWGAVATANRYELQEAISGGAWQGLHSGTGSSYAVSGKAAGNYGYRIRSCLNAGCSGWSGTSEVAVQFAPTSVPTLSIPVTATDGHYSVSWTAVGGATTYTLEESTNGGAWSSAYNGASLSQAYSSKPAGSYAYRAKGCNPAGCGGYSASVTVQALYAPSGAPTISTPPANNNGSYVVGWTAVSGATSFQVEENANSGGWSLFYSGTSGSVAVSGKGTGSFSYRARACNGAGCGGYSAPATTQVTLPPSGAPSLTAPANSSTGGYNVSWTAVAGATSYQLEEKVNGGGWTAVYSGGALTIGLTGRAPATYGYRAIACNSGGCGSYSATASTTVTSIPPTPTGLTGWTDVDTGVRPPYIDWYINWSASPGATYYDLQMQSSATGTPGITYSGAATNWTTGGRGTRTFWVRACSPSGCSAWSAPLAL